MLQNFDMHYYPFQLKSKDTPQDKEISNSKLAFLKDFVGCSILSENGYIYNKLNKQESLPNQKITLS